MAKPTVAKSKKKQPKTLVLNQRNGLLIVLAVVLVLGGMYLALDGPQKVSRMVRGYKIRKTFYSENKALGEPLKSLGFTDIQGGQSKCDEPPRDEDGNIFDEYLKNGDIVFECQVQQNSYRVFGDDKAAKEQLVTAASALKEKMQQNGWKTREDFEMVKWFKDVSGGVDYNPDLYSEKYIEETKTQCTLSFTVAYSKPQPAAINAVFDCISPIDRGPLLEE